MADNEKKLAILNYAKTFSKLNLKEILQELQMNDTNFYKCKYSLEKMQQVEKEIKKRIKKLL